MSKIVSKQTVVFELRMKLLDFIFRSGQYKMLFEHTDMLVLVIYVKNVALGTRTLCEEMKKALSISAYMRIYFSYWQGKIAGWQQSLRQEPAYRISDKAISKKRTERFQLLMKLFDADEEAEVTDEPAGEEMTFLEVLDLLDKNLEQLQENIREIASLPQRNRDLNTDALKRFVNEGEMTEELESERNECRNYCRQKQNKNPRHLFRYLRTRLKDLLGDGSLAHIVIDSTEQEENIRRITSQYFPEEDIFPTDPNSEKLESTLADRELTSKLFCFIDSSNPDEFPAIDVPGVVDYLTLNDFRGKSEAEDKLRRMFAIIEQMREPFTEALRRGDEKGTIVDKRKDEAYRLVVKANHSLIPFLQTGRSMDELNALFRSWLFYEGRDYSDEREILIGRLYQKGRLQMKYYLYLLHEAADYRHVIDRSEALKIYRALPLGVFGYDQATPLADRSVKHYLNEDGYGDNPSWQKVKAYLATFR